MKPPPRNRTKTLPNAKAAPKPQRVSRWTQLEQQRLLRALRSLDQDAELDYASLARRVRTRSCSEVTAAVESLKDKVIACASLELKRKRWEHKRDWKPIEMWTSLASSVAGTTREPISKAFSQMLIISSIEPRSLTSCDPAHIQRPSDGLPGRTEPPKPVPCSSVGGSATVASGPKGKVLLTVQRPLTPGGELATTTSAAAAPSPLSSAAALSPSPSAAAAEQCHPSQDPTTTVTGVSSSVDFEKIYRYLCAVQKPSDQSHLTAMEAAVVLDLLMSLPEELPHLNRRKLQQHLTQVFQCLTSPADSSDPTQLFRSLREVASGQQGAAAAAAASDPQRDGKSRQPPAPGDVTDSAQPSAATDVYPPLNPFLVPLELLMRK